MYHILLADILKKSLEKQYIMSAVQINAFLQMYGMLGT